MESGEFAGTVEKIIFSVEHSGFVVFSLKCVSGIVTVNGSYPQLQAGQQVTVTGTWQIHPKFGKQFQAQVITPHLPSTALGIVKFLSSGLIKGIGPTYAKRLVDCFKEDTLRIIEEEPALLSTVPGIGEKRVDQIIQGWHEHRHISRIMIFLQQHGVSPAYGAKIYKTYGAQTIALIQQNPYRIANDIWGIGFKIADQIAQKLGIEPTSSARINAGIRYALTNALGQGHLYLTVEDAKKETSTLLECEQSSIQEQLTHALHNLYNTNIIKLISHQNTHYIGLAQNYYCEKGFAERIKYLQSRPCTLALDNSSIYTKLRTGGYGNLELHEQQQHGIMQCLTARVTIVTGGPGTGKTTLIKTLLNILDQKNLSYKLAAPTGKAAKRMSQSTGKYALTIHRLLEFDGSSREFTKNETNALKADFIIVDEASMIDIFLAHSLIKAVSDQSHIVFIGDVDQLPSVGAGSVLTDMIESGTIACVRLSHIFRQAQNSLIIVNAHKINTGEFPVTFLPDARKDFMLIKQEDPERLEEHLRMIFKEILPAHSISADSCAVLVPMNRGTVGTQTLNPLLQSMLNPDSSIAISHNGTLFKLYDRVMQIKNNYDKMVFNGDSGTIVNIDLENKTLDVEYQEQTVSYQTHELDELVLAYAMTIHKSQGSEYDVIVCPVFMQHFMLLQRSLLYTAITRAKKLCIFIGQTKALAMGIKNNRTHKRVTLLNPFLQSNLSCRS